jgi:DNA-binding beta-propeller fold protein YncE
VGDGSITLIDVAGRRAMGSIPLGKKTMMSVFSPDGKTAFVAIAGESKIVVFDPDPGR